jgi:Flp pilus assembly protein TadB
MDTAANLDLVGILVPIVALLSIATVPVLYFYFRYRSRQESQSTLRAAIERGLELTPELLQQLGEPAQRKDADLRRGVLTMAVGVGLAAFGLLQGDPEVFLRLRAGGALFFIIGLALLALWRFSNGRQR